MSDLRTHPVEALHEAIDGRLDPRARAALDEHLSGCETCRREFEMLSRMKTQVGAVMRTRDVEVPSDLEARLRRLLDDEDRKGEEPRRASHVRPMRDWWRTAAWAAVAVAVLALPILWSARRPGAPAVSAEVAADFRRLAAGTLIVELTTDDVAALEQQLGAAGLGFATRVFDFGMMDYRLIGGGRHRVSNAPSALFAYAGPGDLRLLCQMYAGDVRALPPPAERRTHNGIDFLVYREGEVTVVFWQEGDVVCVLAANGDPAAAVQLAFAKAVKL